MLEDAIIALKQGVRGPVIERGDLEYDEARKLYNAMIDKRPLLIVRCVDAGDVIAVVNFARERQLALAIRGGGHNGPGFGSVDDGVVIDLSLMRGVRVEPSNQRVRVAAGCLTGDVDHATQAFGLAVPFGIISTTGVAGLTLSGGHGYLSRKYGLTVDNLIEADVVLADGTFVTASATNNADLFWALRGGGGNFGAVTSFLFRSHLVSTIYGGPIIFDFADSSAVMRWYREFQADAPDDLCIFLALQTVPPGDPFPREHWGKKMCSLVACHTGALADAESAVNAVRRALPRPIIDWAGPMPYTSLQTLFDGLYPKGLQWYWKGDFVKHLPDAAIDAHLAHAALLPSPLSAMHLYPIDGQAHARTPDATAWNCRDATWSMVIVAADADAGRAAALKAWATGYWEAVHPFGLEGAYPNFMMDDERPGRLQASFGSNYERLSCVKRKYDPTNLFCVNQNISPAG